MRARTKVEELLTNPPNCSRYGRLGGYGDYDSDSICSLSTNTTSPTIITDPVGYMDGYSCEEERHLRRFLYRKAFEPVSSHSGTNYPCRQSELDKLQLWPGYNHERFVSPNEVLKEIKSHNRENKRYVLCGAEQ